MRVWGKGLIGGDILGTLEFLRGSEGIRGRAPGAWGIRKQSPAGFAFGQGTKKT